MSIVLDSLDGLEYYQDSADQTHSVDSETESKIQDIIDTEFQDCTILAVMHRLDHISRYDMIAFLQDGRLVEYDQPGVLLEQESRFAQLYKKM